MSISMIGIDHSMAPVDIRALFAFTKKNAGEAMEKIKEQPGIYGCIILSTCNRLDVWASVDEEAECPHRRIPEIFHQTGRPRCRRTSFLPFIRPEIPDSGRRPDPHPGKRCPWNRKRTLHHRRCPGSSFPHGCDRRQEDQDRGPFFPRQPFRHPPGHPDAGKTGLLCCR